MKTDTPRRCATCGHFLPASEHGAECATCRRAKRRPTRVSQTLLGKMDKREKQK